MAENGSDNGIDLLEQHLADNPASARFAELAEAWLAEDRLEEALALCETGIGYNPGLPAGHLAYAKVLVRLDNMEDGIQACERACALRAGDPGILCEVGQFLVDQGHHELAIPYLQNALRLDPEDPRVLAFKERMEDLLGVDFERAVTGQWMHAGEESEGWADAPDEESPPPPIDEQVEDEQPTGLDEDDEDEPPTVYEVNPLALQQAKDDQDEGEDAEDDEGPTDLMQSPADRDLDDDEGPTDLMRSPAGQEVDGEDDEGPTAVESTRDSQSTEYDAGSGLRAEVSNAVDELVDSIPGQAPTQFNADQEDEELAQPNRNEPPTVFQEDPEPSPWQDSTGNTGPNVEPPTLFEDALAEALPKKQPYDSTRVSTGTPRGPLFPEPELAAAPSTSISYWKVFLVVVPFLLAAVAGGLYFGYRHLRSEKVSSLLDQSLGSISQDTFAGYGDARSTLLKLVELEEEHPRGRALLALVSARLHAEFGPNLAYRDNAKKMIENIAQGPETEVDLLWARFHASAESEYEELAAQIDKGIQSKNKDPRLLSLAGELAVRRGQLEQGYQHLQASLAEAPSDTRTLCALAKVEIETGRRQKAQEHLMRALAINGIHVRSLLALSQIWVDKGTELVLAREQLEKALKLPQVTDQHRSRAHLTYAHLSFQTGQRSRALAAVKAASALRQDDLTFQRELAKLCLRYYELDEAKSRGKRVRELSSEDVMDQLFLIETELPRGHGKTALPALDDLVGKKVPAAPFLLLRGGALIIEGRYSQALSDLQEIPENVPQRPQAKALLVMALVGAGELDRARKEITALQKSQPDMPLGHVAMGEYRLAKGLRRGAGASFRKALQIDPRTYPAWVHLGRMDYESKDYQDAHDKLVKSLAANPYNVNAHRLLGDVKLRLGRPQEALDSYARVVKELPDSGTSLIGIAEALLDLGNFAKAQTAVRQGRKAGAADAHSRHVEGRVYLANGRFHPAIRALNAADELDNRNPEILADLGLALLGVRSVTRAEKTLKESLRRSRRSRRLPRAQEGLARVLAGKRKWEDAARAYELAAKYAIKKGSPESEVIRLYTTAGSTMLKDTRSGDKRFSRARRLYRIVSRLAPEDPEPLFEIAVTYDREEKFRSARQHYMKVLKLSADHPKALFHLGMLEYDDGKDARAKELLNRFLEKNTKGKLARRARDVVKRIK